MCLGSMPRAEDRLQKYILHFFKKTKQNKTLLRTKQTIPSSGSCYYLPKNISLKCVTGGLNRGPYACWTHILPLSSTPSPQHLLSLPLLFSPSEKCLFFFFLKSTAAGQNYLKDVCWGQKYQLSRVLLPSACTAGMEARASCTALSLEFGFTQTHSSILCVYEVYNPSLPCLQVKT